MTYKTVSETLEITEAALASYTLPPGAGRAWLRDTKLTGFGVIVGQRTFAFVYQRRIKGERSQRTLTLGHWGSKKAREHDADLITVAKAREAAEAARTDMRRGEDPRGDARPSSGPRFSEAYALHLDQLRRKGGRPRSISTMETEIAKHLPDWTDRALVEITRTDCRERHAKLTDENGPYIANRVMRHVRAIYNTALKEHELPANPTVAVHWNKESRRQEPIAWSKLPAWFETVNKLEPILRGGERGGERIGSRSGVRGDYQLLVLLTGLRRMDAATVRWEHIDWKSKTLHRPSPKGGKDRAFYVPLSAECLTLLKRRQSENFNDGGWVFPTFVVVDKECDLCKELGLPAHKRGGVSHLVEAKEQRLDKKTGKMARILPSPHRLRDTYTSALAVLENPPISPYAIDVLTNHRPPRGSVTAGYIALSSEDLREAQERVSEFLMNKADP